MTCDKSDKDDRSIPFIFMQENTILKVLNLAWNGFSNDGALAVGDALKVNTTLTELDLRYAIEVLFS